MLVLQPSYIECLFVFALVWSIGVTTDGTGREVRLLYDLSFAFKLTLIIISFQAFDKFLRGMITPSSESGQRAVKVPFPVRSVFVFRISAFSSLTVSIFVCHVRLCTVRCVQEANTV